MTPGAPAPTLLVPRPRTRHRRKLFKDCRAGQHRPIRVTTAAGYGYDADRCIVCNVSLLPKETR